MRCKMCFKEKSGLQPLRIDGRGTDNHVCKGCYYEIDKIIGFLEESGLSVVWPQESKDSLKGGIIRGGKTKDD